MAKNSSIFKIEGTLDEVTFYKGKEGYLVRRKGGVSKKRIMNDPAFERTRENGAEFGLAAQSGKLVRDVIAPLAKTAKDTRLSSRLTQQMMRVKNLDTVSVRGQRTVFEGVQTLQGKMLLKGFDFNERATLASILSAPISVETETGTITLVNFNPAEQLSMPGGATHVRLKAAFANIEFATGETQITYSEEELLPLNAEVNTVTLTPSVPAVGSGVAFHFLLIEFIQALNGFYYPLKNGAHNVLNIVEVV